MHFGLFSPPAPRSAPLRSLLVGVTLFVLAALLRLVSAWYPHCVERLYSLAVFPLIRESLGCLTALVGFSVGEMLLLVAAAVATILALHVVFQPVRWYLRLLSLLGGATLWAAAIYWSFLLVWGLNYSRQPLAVSTGLDVQPAPVEALVDLSRTLVEEANRSRLEVAEDASGVMRLARGVEGTLAAVDSGFAQVEASQPLLAGWCTRPKPLLLSPLAARLGITGIYSPFTGEANVNTTVPHPELPFAASHEIAHQRGFAREDEANYLGYLACRLHPHPDFRYSGLLAASVHAQNALYRARRSAFDNIEKMRSPGVRRDLAALRAWSDRYRGRASQVAERINDAYLKSQGEAAGVQSYGRVVDLLLAERRAAARAAR